MRRSRGPDLFTTAGPMVVAGTGHRPSHEWWRGVGDWGTTWLHTRVQGWLGEQLDELKPQKVISGMAVGVDTWLALAARERGQPLCAAIPFEGQELRWPDPSQVLYHELLKGAEVVNVSGFKVVEEGGERWLRRPNTQGVMIHTPTGRELVSLLMQIRNKWMVDNCRLVLSVWDGSPGGTGNCMKYVMDVEREFRRLDPSTFRQGGQASTKDFTSR